MGAVLIGAGSSSHKQSVIENMAPVLTLLFTPLFAVLLLVFVATMIWTGNAIDVEREVLIGFDLLLVLVLGLLLYSISARDPQAPPGRFDGLQLLLVMCALLVDVLALWAIARAHLGVRFQPQQDGGARREPAAARQSRLVGRALRAVPDQDALLVRAPRALADGLYPAFAVWAWIVVALFPIIFSYQYESQCFRSPVQFTISPAPVLPESVRGSSLVRIRCPSFPGA